MPYGSDKGVSPRRRSSSAHLSLMGGAQSVGLPWKMAGSGAAVILSRFAWRAPLSALSPFREWLEARGDERVGVLRTHVDPPFSPCGVHLILGREDCES